MVTVSDNAADALRKLIAGKQAAPGSGLRLSIRRGGCAGWQYEMEIAPPQGEDDVIDFEGGRLIVAADSREKLAGCEVDYSDSLSDAGFRIHNPNAARSCGCGTSFESAGEAPPGPADLEDCGKS